MISTGAAKQLFRSFQETRKKRSVLQQVREYRRFVPLHFETDDFLITTAAGGTELLKVLELRHEVFVQEWQGRSAGHGLDVDDFDFVADHLMIFDKRIQEVIGTYRLISSHFTHGFYSSSEFELREFLRLPAVKLELGRACVHPNFRDGNSIDLLWKGLTRYIALTKTEFLFGCSSIKTTNATQINRLHRTLRDQGSWVDEFGVRSTDEYRLHGFAGVGDEAARLCSPLDQVERRELIPPLLRSYLHAGAKVYGHPAFDADFACVDLLTILNWSDLNRRFRTRFC